MTKYLTKKQYDSVCYECDQLLLADEATLERICIPWLHVIREHPIFLKRYEQLFQKNPGYKYLANLAWKNFKSWLSIVKTLIKSMFGDGVPYYGKIAEENIEILFVSHLLDASMVTNSKDFYFDRLPQSYSSSYNPVLIALLNHTGQPARKLAANLDQSGVSRVILSRSLNVIDEIKHLKQMWHESKQLESYATLELGDLSKKVNKVASKEAISSESIGLLRFYIQIAEIVKKVKPKVIITTHEGHAIERVAYAAARSSNPDICCVGYQHAALFKKQHSIRRNLSSEFNPDRVLSSGPIPKEMLEKSFGREDQLFAVLGSNRMLSNEAISRASNNPPDKPVCLVIPEGILSECSVLLEFSLKCALFDPNTSFIWRFHPLTPYHMLQKRNKIFKNIPSNITVSKMSLEEDICRSTIVLYRGSTAVIAAVSGLCRPVYLSSPGEMTIDPLYELDNRWKVSANKVSDLLAIFYLNAAEIAELREDREKSIHYSRCYYTAFDVDVLKML